MIDPSHCDGLPDGHTRATIVEFPHRDLPATPAEPPAPLTGLLPHRHRPDVAVAARPLADYAKAAQAVVGR